MSNLAITNCNGVLVVDSRLIAEELGIRHKNFLATIDKYNPKMASSKELGPAAFETRVVKRSQGGTYEERWSWLTEAQTTFIMTLSRNTEQVINCKLALSVAFEKAKKVVQETLPAQASRIRELELELEVAKAQQAAAAAQHQATTAQQKLMASCSALAIINSALPALVLGKPDAVLTQREVIEKTVLVNAQGRAIATYQGYSKTKLAKRYGMGKPQDFVNWLQSIDREDYLQPGLTATPCQYVPFELVAELDALWSQQQGTRQRLIGE